MLWMCSVHMRPLLTGLPPTLSLPCPVLAGHTSKFGHPEPTQVRITPKVGKAILIRWGGSVAGHVHASATAEFACSK